MSISRMTEFLFMSRDESSRLGRNGSEMIGGGAEGGRGVLQTALSISCLSASGNPGGGTRRVRLVREEGRGVSS